MADANENPCRVNNYILEELHLKYASSALKELKRTMDMFAIGNRKLRPRKETSAKGRQLPEKEFVKNYFKRSYFHDYYQAMSNENISAELADVEMQFQDDITDIVMDLTCLKVYAEGDEYHPESHLTGKFVPGVVNVYFRDEELLVQLPISTTWTFDHNYEDRFSNMHAALTMIVNVAKTVHLELYVTHLGYLEDNIGPEQATKDKDKN